MKEISNLHDLLVNEIQILYSAEKLIEDGLETMVDKANDVELTTMLREHLEETRTQIRRLEQIAAYLTLDLENDKNMAVKGLISEGEKVMKKEVTEDTLDAALIAAAQKIEHYEISGYGTAACYAEELGMGQVADLLRQTLIEEQLADTKLNNLAKRRINLKTINGSENKQSTLGNP